MGKVIVVVRTQEKAIAWLMSRDNFGLFRDPIAVLQPRPLYLTLAQLWLKCNNELTARVSDFGIT
jgi:hypothetical protein